MFKASQELSRANWSHKSKANMVAMVAQLCHTLFMLDMTKTTYVSPMENVETLSHLPHKSTDISTVETLSILVPPETIFETILPSPTPSLGAPFIQEVAWRLAQLVQEVMLPSQSTWHSASMFFAPSEVAWRLARLVQEVMLPSQSEAQLQTASC